MKHLKFFNICCVLSLSVLVSCACRKGDKYSYVFRKAPLKDTVVYYPFTPGDEIIQTDTLTRKGMLNFIWRTKKTSRPLHLSIPQSGQIVGEDADWTLIQFPNSSLLLVCFGRASEE